MHIQCQGTGITRFQKALTYSLAVCSLAGLGGAAFLNRAALAREMHDWQVLPHPERLSELYFTNPREQHAPTSDGVQQIQFNVHNLEHRATTYRYSIVAVATGNGTEYQLGDGVFTIARDGLQTTSRDITLPLVPGRTIVKIKLTYEGIAAGHSIPSPQTQSIHYWIDAPGEENSAE